MPSARSALSAEPVKVRVAPAVGIGVCAEFMRVRAERSDAGNNPAVAP